MMHHDADVGDSFLVHKCQKSIFYMLIYVDGGKEAEIRYKGNAALGQPMAHAS